MRFILLNSYSGPGVTYLPIIHSISFFPIQEVTKQKLAPSFSEAERHIHIPVKNRLQ